MLRRLRPVRLRGVVVFVGVVAVVKLIITDIKAADAEVASARLPPLFLLTNLRITLSICLLSLCLRRLGRDVARHYRRSGYLRISPLRKRQVRRGRIRPLRALFAGIRLTPEPRFHFRSYPFAMKLGTRRQVNPGLRQAGDAVASTNVVDSITGTSQPRRLPLVAVGGGCVLKLVIGALVVYTLGLLLPAPLSFCSPLDSGRDVHPKPGCAISGHGAFTRRPARSHGAIDGGEERGVVGM